MATLGDVINILTVIFNMLVEIFGGFFGSAEDGEANEPADEPTDAPA